MSMISTTQLCQTLGMTMTTEKLAEMGVHAEEKPDGAKRGTFYDSDKIPTYMRKIAKHLTLNADSTVYDKDKLPKRTAKPKQQAAAPAEAGEDEY